jgi:hypothetical protein
MQPITIAPRCAGRPSIRDFDQAAMSYRLPFAAMLIAALLSAGCGTFQNVKQPAIPPPDNPNLPVCKIYGGLRSDAVTMLDYPWSQTTSYIDYVTVPVLATVDLFLDAIGDTFTLPISVVKTVRRSLDRPESPSNYYLPVEVPILTPQPGAAPQGTPLTPPRPVPSPTPTSPR